MTYTKFNAQGGGKVLSGRGKAKRFTLKGELRKVLQGRRTTVDPHSLLVWMAQRALAE
jgi:hypothetical protein